MLRRTTVLRSVRDLENLRVIASDGAPCGRVRDVYFDDQSWALKYLVLALDRRQFGARQVLLTSDQISLSPLNMLSVHLPSDQLYALPLASSVLPVCGQYARMALNSPGAAGFAAKLSGADPHLRSARAVLDYQINVAGQCEGRLTDFLFEHQSWEIRYLAVEHVIENRRIHFHILPQSVERFTWATQRVLLRDLQPVEMAAEQSGAILAA